MNFLNNCSVYLKGKFTEELRHFPFQVFKRGIVVKTAVIIDFIFGSSDKDMLVPFVGEIPHVADGNINVLIFRTAFDKGRKAVVVSSNVDKGPMVCFAYRF